MKAKVLNSAVNSQQKLIIEDGTKDLNGLINPPIEFEKLIKLGSSAYNLLCINIKLELLSQIKNLGNLKEKLPINLSPQKFLKKILLNYEILGNAFVEKTQATSTKFNLFNINTKEIKLDEYYNIYQISGQNVNKLYGFMMQQDNLSSNFYGIPAWFALEDEINLFKFANAYNLRFFRTGGSPRKIIKFQNSEIDEKSIEDIKSFMSSNFGGSFDGINQTLILATGETANAQASIEIEDLHKVTDMSFKDLKEISRDTILALHLIPPRIAGIMSNGLAGGSEVREQLMMLNNILVVPRKRELENFMQEIGVEGFELHSLDTTTFKDDLTIFTNLARVTGDSDKAKKIFNEFKEENRE